MDRNNTIDANEFSVNEGAFWHTNMDLYYGYQPGEVVEVEHESNKYWLASIRYSFRHLILLKWIGDYGEFWVDTSMQNHPTTSSNSNFTDVFNTPKRLFPPGYHLQSQLKSLFTLERPTKVLVKPSLYNPANDPYAEVRTVDDLLALEVSPSKDAFANQTSSSNSNELTSAVLAKCKTKISYSQEDVDELDAALQNLNEIDSNQANEVKSESPNVFNDNGSANSNLQYESTVVEAAESGIAADEKKFDTRTPENIKPTDSGSSSSSSSSTTKNNCELNPCESEASKEESGEATQTIESVEEKPQSDGIDLPDVSNNSDNIHVSDESASDNERKKALNMCQEIQYFATKFKYYDIKGVQIDKPNYTIERRYRVKPKQFYEVGGANQERVLVPGTLLEVAHVCEKDTGLELYHWFAVVLKNVGGRLTLRWFLCDEPKFKQGRLELKSFRSEFTQEEDEQENAGDKEDDDRCGLVQKTKLLAKEMTFSMHFCNPCVHSISHAKSIDRAYKMPVKLIDFIEDSKGVEIANSIEQAQMKHVFDFRRTNLDKDRPIIDHLLETIRSITPQYVRVQFANDTNSRKEVLLSTPKTTKLLRGFVKREIEPGVFEVHSEQNLNTGEVIKFIYPYDSSYSILPTSWAVNNEDCLSVQPSRNPTPIPASVEGNPQTCVFESDQDSGVGQTEDSQKIEHMEEEKKPSFDLEDFQKKLRQRGYITAIDPNGVARKIKDRPSGMADFFGQVPARCYLDEYFEPETGPFYCSLEDHQMDLIVNKFRVMDQLEVVHPSSDTTICLGRIRKVVYPLLWIQISSDSYTLLPFNSTDIYPVRWCEANNYPLVSLLPPLKRLNQTPSSQADKKRKKTKTTTIEEVSMEQKQHANKDGQRYEHLDLCAINDKQLDLDCILNEKSMYIRIYFNHKCFTGPSLSKGKICSLPQYVGPGPLRLVIDEVVTKIISVAYVPPRILNDLSSKSFEDLLIARNLTNTTQMEFKAKYQKRVHREDIPVCLSPDDVALYCECICEHLKCCYNLFGPNLYDGDDCPGHCRALTKSNKFMKRATYYREKARLGEFLNDNSSKKSTSSNNNNNNNASSKTSRARYAGRDSSESTCSSLSRSEQIHSRDSSNGEETPMNELKENLQAVEEIENENEQVTPDGCSYTATNIAVNQLELPASNRPVESDMIHSDVIAKDQEKDKMELNQNDQQEQHQQAQNINNVLTQKTSPESPNGFEFNLTDAYDTPIEDWTVEDVADHLEKSQLGKFKWLMTSEGVDGQALLLLDKAAIREHFQHQPKSKYTQEELTRLCMFVEFARSRAGSAAGI